MKTKIKAIVPFVSLMLLLTGLCNASYAQTFANSVKISGGEFGTGKTLVFQDEGAAMNKALYVAATSDGKTTIRINGSDVKYKGKEINLLVMITLMDGKSAGGYTLKKPDTPPPPNAEVSVQIGAVEGITGHFLNSESGNVNVTSFGKPGNFMTGTFSGSFYEIVDGKKINYQVSGKLKAFRIANDEN